MSVDLATRSKTNVSVVPPAHWRCKWSRAKFAAEHPTWCFLPLTWLVQQRHLPEDTIVIDDHTWISPPRFLTRERADEDGARCGNPPVVLYVEAVKFDGEAP